MKKLFYSTFIFAALLTSCGGGDEESKKDGEEDKTESNEAKETNEVKAEVSTAGNWSTADKEKADAAIAAIDSELAAFGDSKQDFIDCYLGKVENSYNSFDEADQDLDGCSQIAQDCASEVMGL